MEKSYEQDSDPFFGEQQDDDSIEKEFQEKFNLANRKYGEQKLTKSKGKKNNKSKPLDVDNIGRSRDLAQSKSQLSF